MTRTIYCLTALLCALCLAISSQNTARAADQGIVATVNDIPITSFDIDQRLRNRVRVLTQARAQTAAEQDHFH